MAYCLLRMAYCVFVSSSLLLVQRDMNIYETDTQYAIRRVNPRKSV
jgi:hypothetical protein